MHLKTSEEIRFFRVFNALTEYVNKTLRIVGHRLDDFTDDKAYNKGLTEVLERLWADRSIIDRFLMENPDGLSSSDRKIAENWKSALHGTFVLAKHEGGYSYLVIDDKAYAVVGLSKDVSTMLPEVPRFVQTTLLPFEGHIVYDTQMMDYPFQYSENMVSLLLDDFEKVRASGEVYKSAQALIRNAGYHSEEEHQRHLNHLIDEYNKEKRRANPEEFMPEGMHKGILAGLTFEERQARIKECSKTDNEDYFGPSTSFSYILRKLPKAKPQTTLEAAFAITTKDMLVSLAKAFEIPSPGKLKKEELIKELKETPDFLKTLLANYYVYTNDRQFELFNELVNNNGVITRKITGLKPQDFLLPLPPLICHFKHDDYITTVLPREFRDCLEASGVDSLMLERNRQKRIFSCARAFVELYGLVSLPDFLEMYQSYYPDDALEGSELFETLFEATLSEELPYKLWFEEEPLDFLDSPEEPEAVELQSPFGEEFFFKSLFLVDSTLAKDRHEVEDEHYDFFDEDESFGLGEDEDIYDDDEDFEDDEDFDDKDTDDDIEEVIEVELERLAERREHLLKRHRKIPRKLLRAEELDDFFMHSYCQTIPQVQELLQFFDAHVPDGENDMGFADLMLFLILDGIKIDADMDYYFDVFAEVKFDLGSVDYTNDFLEVFNAALNAIPRWANNGHSPVEYALKLYG